MPALPANKYHKVRIHLPPQRPRILPPQRPQPPPPQAPRVFTIGASAPAPSSRKCPECSMLATEMVPRRPGYITRILSFLWALTQTPRTLRPEPSVQVSESYLCSGCSQITMEIGPDQLISSFIPTLMQCVDYITPMLSFRAVRFMRIITPILQYFEPPRRDVEWLIFCAWTGPDRCRRLLRNDTNREEGRALRWKESGRGL
ncbi:hypothetical protein FB567DRAFT_523028 [Paraphoma chrysanthemicola]|uniref:Uncharacterized protein n=1 Tax=Paraphoma chrysanthemicola TaxID=798071 RepID=A0A8K0R9M6_9PLEO|nr:hypothetical protein FB567DRAFT_523028 [Paraphoma chrysanthemicola]